VFKLVADIAQGKQASHWVERIQAMEL